MTIKCSVCGGDLIRDYKNGVCRCGHCLNQWPLSENDPDFGEYSRFIGAINKADDLVGSGSVGLKQIEEALLLYKNTMVECSLAKPSEAMAEIRELCKSSAEKCEQLKKYETAKEHLKNGAYSKAFDELSQLGDMKETAELLEECREGMKKERIRRIPYSIAVGLILPAILFFFVKERSGLGLALPVSAAFAAADIFVLYLNNGFSTVIEVFSFILLIPLLIFLFLTYVLHVAAMPAALLSIGIPIVIAVILGFMAEK